MVENSCHHYFKRLLFCMQENQKKISVKFKQPGNKSDHGPLQADLSPDKLITENIKNALPKDVTKLTSQAYSTLTTDDKVEVLAEILTTVRKASLGFE